MKRNQLNLLAIVAVTIFSLSSCSSKMYTTRQVPIVRESIPTNPIIADLDVDISKKISGESVVTGKSATVENAKQLALWNAMEENNADVIVDPIFSLDIRLNRIDAKVIGYKGTYKDVHTATKKEIENLLMYREAQPMMIQKDGTGGTGKFFQRLMGK